MMVKSTRRVDSAGLNSQEATEILDQLDDQTNDASILERRRSPRGFKVGMAKVLSIDAEPANVRIHLRNISDSGIAFIGTLAFKPGTRINLRLSGTRSWRSLKKEAIVVRCRQIKHSVFEIGAEFTDAGRK